MSQQDPPTRMYTEADGPPTRMVPVDDPARKPVAEGEGSVDPAPAGGVTQAGAPGGMTVPGAPGGVTVPGAPGGRTLTNNPGGATLPPPSASTAGETQPTPAARPPASAPAAPVDPPTRMYVDPATRMAPKTRVAGASPKTAVLQPGATVALPKGGPVSIGAKLGKYVITGMLGKGGMGVVYEAEDSMIERKVAIKIMPPAVSADPLNLKRFLQEAKSAGRLNHPNAVGVYDVDSREGMYYLVMELVKGGSAQDFLNKRGAFNWPEATRVIADACRGLGAAHSEGLIHRDIKPANILRSAKGGVKLADFGLAKIHEGTTGSGVSVSMVIGTPEYMSPEQCRGEKLDLRTDLYSMGATYYALLTGKSPYHKASNIAQLLFSHVNSPVPDPRTTNAIVPDGCVAVINKAMAKNPADRYQRAEQMLADLEALTAAPATAQPAEGAAAAAPVVAAVPAEQADASWDQFLAAVESRGSTQQTPSGEGKVRTVGIQTQTVGLTSTQLVPNRPASRRIAKPGVPVWAYGAAGGAVLVLIILVVILVSRGGGGAGPAEKDKDKSAIADKDKSAIKDPPPVIPDPIDDPTKRPPDVPPDPPVVESDPVMDLYGRLMSDSDTAARSGKTAALARLVRQMRAFAGEHGTSAKDNRREAAAQLKTLAERYAGEINPTRVMLRERAGPPPFSDTKTRPTAAALSADGKLVLITGADNSVQWVSSAPGASTPGRFDLAGGAALAAAITGNGQVVWTVGADGRVRGRELQADVRRPEATLGTAALTAAAFSADGQTLAAADNGAVRVFEFAGGLGKRRGEIALSGRPATALALVNDGSQIAAADRNGVRIWDSAGGKPVAEFRPSSAAQSLAFSPEGGTLAVGCADGSIRLFDTAVEREVAVVPASAKAITALAWSADGRTVAAGAEDGAVKLFDALRLQTLWADDFESYPAESWPGLRVGEPPAPWPNERPGQPWIPNAFARGGRQTNNFVDPTTAAAGKQSFRIHGSPAGNNGALVFRALDGAKPLREPLYIELSIRHALDSGGNNGQVALRKYPFWEGSVKGPGGENLVNAGRGLLGTHDNGTLTDTTGALLHKRDPKAWVKVLMRLEIAGDKFVVSYWVNDEFKVRHETPAAATDAECALLQITSGHGSIWYDDVRVMREPR